MRKKCELQEGYKWKDNREILEQLYVYICCEYKQRNVNERNDK